MDATPNSFDKPIKKHPNFFVVLGKLVLFLLVAALFIIGGYYFGTHNKKLAMEASISPTQVPTATLIPSEILPSPTPASPTSKAVKAGLSGTTVFEAYSIEVPPGWTDARETTITAGLDKLTLTKNGYSVTIYQAPMGGGGCLYPDDPQSEDLPAGRQVAQTYTYYADINGKSGQYRRSWTKGTGQALSYTVCQKGTDGSYGIITKFGAITVVSPNPAIGAMLYEIDGMIASLTKQ